MARRARLLLAMADPETVIEQWAQRLEVERPTRWQLCRRFDALGVPVVFDAPRRGRPGVISPLERVSLEQLACGEPAGVGLYMPPWSTRRLAYVAMERGIVPPIAHSTGSLIWRHAELQPHRDRYWKTPTRDAAFRQRAARGLGCSESAPRGARRGEWLSWLDEKPSIQALERCRSPCPRRPGQLEHQEFAYIRHGPVNFLVALVVHSGQLQGWGLEHNDSQPRCQVLPPLFEPYPQGRRLQLIGENGPSPIAEHTHRCLRQYGHRVRVLVTPVHAAWRNQAERLLGAFAEPYLKRGDGHSRPQLIAPLDASWPEYNRWYAHPFTWSWTRRRMQQWVDQHQ